MSRTPEILIVMGVCGVGKTSIARLLSASLPAIYVEADDFHPEGNIEAMSRGEALTDEMRFPWLRGIAEEIISLRQQDARANIVVACSALKRSYRDLIRSYIPQAKVIFLTGDKELISERMRNRTDHFMPLELLDSQLATLEPPEADESHLAISIADTPDKVVSNIVSSLNSSNDTQST